MVMIFAIHQQKPAVGTRPEPPPPLPYSVPLGPRALALGARLQALNLYWSSVLHMVMYMYQCCSLKIMYFFFFDPLKTFVTIRPLTGSKCLTFLEETRLSIPRFPDTWLVCGLGG